MPGILQHRSRPCQPAILHAKVRLQPLPATCKHPGLPSASKKATWTFTGTPLPAVGRLPSVQAGSGGGPTEPGYTTSNELSSSGKNVPTSQRPFRLFGLETTLFVHLVWCASGWVSLKALDAAEKCANIPPLLSVLVYFIGGAFNLGLAALCVRMAPKLERWPYSMSELFTWPKWCKTVAVLLGGSFAVLLAIVAALAELLVGQQPVPSQSLQPLQTYPVWMQQMVTGGWGSRIIYVCGAGVLEPAAGVLMYYGWLLPRLAVNMPCWAAAVVSALVSSLITCRTPDLFAASVVLNMFFFWTRSLWPFLILHCSGMALGCAVLAVGSQYLRFPPA